MKLITLGTNRSLVNRKKSEISGRNASMDGDVTKGVGQGIGIVLGLIAATWLYRTLHKS